MNPSEFDRLVETIRQTEPDPQVVAAAAARVHDKLVAAERSSFPTQLCAAFRNDFDAYRTRTLGEGRRMLLDDHLSSCVACRGEFSGETAATRSNVVSMKGTARPVVAISPARPPARRVAFRRIALLAAAAALTVGLGLALPPVLDRALAPTGPRGTVASVSGTLMLVSSEGTQPLTMGAPIEEGQEVRTGRDSHAVIHLSDGSSVEMDERTDLNLTERWLGKTVHLTRGSVMVEAAKQRHGRLEIATADALVSVKGTIFSVSRGLKGSRVSVVEGEVQVQQGDNSQFLHRGDQAVTHPSMERTAVETEIAWSQNAAKYSALLADLTMVANKIGAIPMPALRYQSTLLDRVPASAVVVASIPNLGQVLGEATQVFDERARESAALSEWWNSAGSQQMRDAIERVRAVSDYLGDEVIIAVSPHHAPLVLAEIRRPGLIDYFTQSGYKGPVAFEGSFVAIGADAVPAPSDFPSTAFGMRILESYRAGTSLLLAINLEQITANGVLTSSVPSSATSTLTTPGTSNPASMAGFDNARFLIAERKTNLGIPDNTASLSFAGPRHGLASWLATPGPIGSLEFISAQATFAAALVARDPRVLLQEILKTMGDSAEQGVQAFQAATGVDPVNDIAESLGSEATVSVDGAVLPFPDWKVAIEVDNPGRLQKSMEALFHQYSQSSANAATPVTYSNEIVEGRTYYSLVLSKPAITIHYTFVDGYLLAGANRALLMTAISNRTAGLTLPKSAAFRAQLPMDDRANYSGVLYYNFGAVVGQMLDQLKATGLVPAEQQAKFDKLTANREPSIVYMYGGPDRLTIGSRSELLGVGLRTLAGFASGNSGSAMPFLGIPMLGSLLPSAPSPKAPQ